MPTASKRYYSGVGFESPDRSRNGRNWLLLILILLVTALGWYLLTRRQPTGFLLVTADSTNLPVNLDLNPSGEFTPVLLTLPGNDSITVSLALRDQVSQPAHFRLLPQPGETLSVHFKITQLLEPLVSTSPATPLSVVTAIPATPLPADTLPRQTQTAGDLLLPSTATTTPGLFLLANLPGVNWLLNDSSYQAEGKQLFVAAEGTHPLLIVPQSTGIIFSPESLIVIPAELFDPYLYFYGRQQAALQFTLLADPVQVGVLLNGQELGVTPLELRLDQLEVDLRFNRPPGFFIPPPLNLNEITAGSVITLFLERSYDMSWLCSPDTTCTSGYIMPGESLVIDEQDDRQQVEEEWVWQLGPQFLIKRPHGSRGLVCDFSLPLYDRERQWFRLQLEGRDSGRNYPFTLRDLCTLTVRVNGRILMENEDVTTAILTAANTDWDISRYLHPGSNRLVVQVGENSLHYFHLNSVSVTTGGGDF